MKEKIPEEEDKVVPKEIQQQFHRHIRNYAAKLGIAKQDIYFADIEEDVQKAPDPLPERYRLYRDTFRQIHPLSLLLQAGNILGASSSIPVAVPESIPAGPNNNPGLRASAGQEPIGDGVAQKNGQLITMPVPDLNQPIIKKGILALAPGRSHRENRGKFRRNPRINRSFKARTPYRAPQNSRVIRASIAGSSSINRAVQLTALGLRGTSGVLTRIPVGVLR